MVKNREQMPEGYEAFIGEVKERIRSAQVRAALAVNRELILLYWSIGRDILNRQAEQGWGARVIEQMAVDLSQAFPAVTGFRVRNLRYMRSLAEAYPDPEFVQQVVAQLPWGHQCPDPRPYQGCRTARMVSCARLCRTAGAGTSSFTRSKAICTAAKAPH